MLTAVGSPSSLPQLAVIIGAQTVTVVAGPQSTDLAAVAVGTVSGLPRRTAHSFDGVRLGRRIT